MERFHAFRQARNRMGANWELCAKTECDRDLSEGFTPIVMKSMNVVSEI